ncbi:MAG: S8 family serine peptidase [Alphaproteobacteria bacterium]|nr:S8 family serine peptidase [Alphaproteobacteria bacterium]
MFLLVAACQRQQTISDADGQLARHSSNAGADDTDTDETAVESAEESTLSDLPLILLSVLPSTSAIPGQYAPDAYHHLEMLNAPSLWRHATGQQSTVIVWDSGIDVDNPDLAIRTDGFLSSILSLSEVSGNHGNRVASVVAGEDNSVGTVGLAYNAEVVPFLSSASWARQDDNPLAAITAIRSVSAANGSWRSSSDFYAGSAESTDLFLFDMDSLGRDGYGAPVFFASGNYHDKDDSTAAVPQNRMEVTTVGALNANGRPVDFSSSGSNVLLAAQGNEVYASDYSNDKVIETAAVNGTSFSSPALAAMAALIGSIDPTLGSRDIQDIMVLSAAPVEQQMQFDETAPIHAPFDFWDANRQFNAAHQWNNGSQEYTLITGFGVPDGETAGRLAQMWRFFFDEHKKFHTIAADDRAIDLSLPEDGIVPISATASLLGDLEGFWVSPLQSHDFTFTIADDLDIESVILTADVLFEPLNAEGKEISTSAAIEQVDLIITSPMGTRVDVLQHFDPFRAISFGDNNPTVVDWDFLARIFRGESSRGEWTLTIENNFSDGTNLGFTVQNPKLVAHGDPIDAPDITVFDQSFFSLVAADPSRAVLTDHDAYGRPASHDATDRDIMAFAGIDQDVILYLSASASEPSSVGDVALTVENNIDDAAGGSGNDRLIGTTAANRLWGGDGNDRLEGGQGADRLHGSWGDDTLFGGDGDDQLQGGGGADVIHVGEGQDIVIFDAGMDTVVLEAASDAVRVRLAILGSSTNTSNVHLYKVVEQGEGNVATATDLVLDFGTGMDRLVFTDYFNIYLGGGASNALSWENDAEASLTLDIANAEEVNPNDFVAPLVSADSDFSPW